MNGKLFVIATPIGNLEDITFRAVRILKSVDYVLAESPRYSKRLLEHYNVKTRVFKYNDDYKVDSLIAKTIDNLRSGFIVALISDAGTPTISDPGYRLIKACRDENLEVVPIPGPSALIAALSVSGFPTDRFVFLGFLPKGWSKKKKVLKEVGVVGGTVVFYESPNRVIKSLEAVKETLGGRKVFVAREITKIHEELIFGEVDEIIDKLKKRSSLKGEFVILVKKEDV